MTVFSIVYNEYGHFIPQWIEWINKQTIKVKIIVVLGKNHGADIEWLKKNKIKYIECDSANMGVLRNAGLEQVKTDWWLYFSVDDELLPNACEEIINSNADVVSIKFDVIEPNGTIKKECNSPHITNMQELNNWSRCWGGYVAVKGNTDIRFREDIEVPNLTLHFELFKRGLKVIQSNKSLAIHHRWSNSHHFRSGVDGRRLRFVDEIERTKNEILEEVLRGGNYMYKIEITGDLSSLQGFEKCLDKDGNLLKSGVIRKGTILKVDKDMYSYINGANKYRRSYCKLIDIEEIQKEQKEIKVPKEIKTVKKKEVKETIKKPTIKKQTKKK